ncbi:MAG: hypothetical protein Sapg2KO_33020 [Saprospiraceae bacterium]
MNKRFTLNLIITLLFLAPKLSAQQGLIDSLEQELTLEQHDTIRAKTLTMLCGQFRYTDRQKGVDYAKEAIQILEKYPQKGELRANAFFQIAALFYFSNKADSALLALDNCLTIARKNKLLKLQSGALGLQGGIYERSYQLDKAIETFNQSVEIAKALNDSSRLGAEYGNIANVYYRQENNESAERYAKLALEIAQVRKDTPNMHQPVYLLSGIEPDPKQRIDYINLAIDLCFKTNRLSTLGLVYSSKGGYHYEEEKDYIKAIESFRQGLNYSLKYNRKRAAASNSNFLARCFLKTNQADSVLKYARLGTALGQETEAINQVINGYSRLSDYFERVNRMDSAYYYLNKVSILKDSVYESQLEEQISEADAQFENEQARTEIAKQDLEIAQQKSLTNQIIAGALFLLLLLTAIFQWYFFRQRRKKRETEMALQLQQLEAQNLKELDQSKSRFFANLSHELRTPLTLILGPLKNALANSKQAANPKDLQLAHNNGEKLLSLVNEIMDLSKLESGKLQLYPTSVPIMPFLRRIFYAYESAATIRRIDLVLESSLEDELHIELDQAKVEKILNNLLSNALKFSAAGDEILMEVQEQPGHLAIKIIDNGIGIAKEDLPHLFNRFYQAEQPMEQLSGGTGIGLSLAKELAILHGGEINVESQVGMGSTFTLLLPFKEAQAPIEFKERSEEVIVNPYLATSYQPFLLNGDKARILIVEDNVEMSNFLQHILSPYFHCQNAFDGQQALEILHKSKIDLIVSDVMMPNMDGFTFRKKVSEAAPFKDIPFIMLTARAEDQDKIRGLQLGVNDYMPKPFNTQELIARIHNLLKNRLSRQAAVQEESQEESISVDERFIKKAEAVVLEHLDEVEFKVTHLAKALNYSQRQLSRVLKKYTGLSPVEFILEIRLQKAYQLIQQQRYLSVSEIRYDVGIESASYFSKKFTERFGESPSNLLKK